MIKQNYTYDYVKCSWSPCTPARFSFRGKGRAKQSDLVSYKLDYNWYKEHAGEPVLDPSVLTTWSK